MSKTPKKRRVSLATVDSPAALKGKRIACPGPIFHESPEKIYAGVVLGTPSGKKNSVTVRFDEDGTKYWCVLDNTCIGTVQRLQGLLLPINLSLLSTTAALQREDCPDTGSLSRT